MDFRTKENGEPIFEKNYTDMTDDEKEEANEIYNDWILSNR